MDISILKKDLYKALESLPDPIPFKQLQSLIDILQAIKTGQDQVESGHYISHEEFEKRLSAWQQK